MDANELHDDLDAYVLGDDELEAGDEPTEAPPDADRANSLLRVLRGVEREARRIDMLATQEITRIESWRSDRLAGLDRRHVSLSKALEQWMRAVNRVTPKRKTEKLPNGTLSLRAPRGKVVVTDEAKFVEWWRNDARMTVARWLVDRLGNPAKEGDTPELWSAELVELVLSRSPVVRVKIEPNKTGLAELERGPEISSDDDETTVALVLDGEQVPWVGIATSASDTFSVSV